MRKLISFVALFFCALISQAHVTISVADVAFGEVALSSGSAVATTNMPVTWTNLDSYEYIYAMVTEGSSVFSIENGATDIYGYQYLQTDENPVKFSIKCSATAAGTYNGKIHVYAWGDEDDNWAEIEKTVNVSVTVVSEKVSTFTRLEKTADVKDGDVVVLVYEDGGAVCGKFDEISYKTALPSITDDVKLDKTNHTVEVPSTAQTFTLKSVTGGWELNAGSYKLGGTSGLELKPGEGTTTWTISISSGVAEITPKGGEHPIKYNTGSPRFKIYSSNQAGIALYKKTGEAEAESKLTITPATIDFGAVATTATKELTVSYAAEHLTDLNWDLDGTDKADFELVEGSMNTDAAGTLTIRYKGTSTKSAPVVSLYYLYNDVKGVLADGDYTIGISLVPFNGIAFKNATYKTNTNTDFDLSGEVTFDPTTLAAEHKGLTWKVSPNTFASVSEAGVLKATASGEYTVTATSAFDPTKKAECKVTVEVVKVTDFTLSDTEVKLNVNGTHTLSVTAYVPDNASGTPSYKSADATIATVSNKGVITGKKLGETTITVTVDEVNKTCKVIVEKVTVTDIAFDKSEMTLSLGSSLQLDPTVTPAQAKDEYTISWNSDNTDAATVSDAGLVTSKAVGDAVITAKINGLTANITIHVVAPKTFAKLTDPSLLAAKDTIILANVNVSVIAGAHKDNKLLEALKTDITLTADEAYADNAIRLVLGTEKGKEGFTLTPVGSSYTLAATSSGTDVAKGTTKNSNLWSFVADGTNGVYVQNALGNTFVLKYYASNDNIKVYKAAGAVYMYVYYRKFVDTPTAVDQLQAAPEARKIIRNGQIIIIRNGVEYSIDGRQL